LFGVIVWFVLSYLSSILYAYGAHTIKDIIAWDYTIYKNKLNA